MNECKFRFLLCITLTILWVILGRGQLIQGKVTDSNGKLITGKILIKKNLNTQILSEYILVGKGDFSYTLKNSYTDSGLVLEVTSVGYKSHFELIAPSELENLTDFNFILSKEKIEILDEVVVEGKRPYLIKKDTITFDVEAYKDGTENSVEDLLKNLPGIEVDNNSGIVKYRGRSIETVTIEGDNLFDYNYSIGTKNIGVDLVKEIEAIENYSENKLLKGIEHSDKVILNLRLKENKSDITGSTDFGAGVFTDSKNPSVDVNLNLLGINKTYKSFAITSYNNIGENSSPFNYYDNTYTLEQLKDQDYFGASIIPEYKPLQVTESNLSNINSQVFGNFNGIFDITDKLNTKINLYYLSDKIDSNQFIASSFIANDEEFRTFDNSFNQKKPKQYRGDIELKFDISKSSLLNYNVSFRDETVITNRTIFSNQDNDFNSILKSKSQFLKQDVQYTKRISEKNAVQLSLLNAFDDFNEEVTISPSIYNSNQFNQDNQNNNAKKLTTFFKSTFLGKTKSADNYSFSFGFNLNNETFRSNLINLNTEQQEEINVSSNNLKFVKNDIFAEGRYNWQVGKFTFSPKSSLRYLCQKLENNITPLDSDNFVFQPALSIIFKIDRTSIINLSSGLNQNMQLIQNLFSNPILIDNRILKSNIPDITLQKNQSYGLSFSKNDLYNQLELSFGSDYIKSKGNYFTNSEISETSIRTTNFFLSENTENLNLYLKFSKLLSFLKTNVKTTSNYSIFNFKNIVNNSNLTDSKSTILSNSLFLKTAFAFPINFENKTTFLYQRNRGQSLFENKSMRNNLKLIYKSSKYLFGSVTCNYFIPNIMDSTNTYSFLDATISFSPENKDWEVSMSGINLLNEDFFVNRDINDVSANMVQVNLLSRYYIINFTHSF